MTRCDCDFCNKTRRGAKLNGFCPHSRFSFPPVVKTFQKLISQDLVSIQPMTLPPGNIFYIDYTYGSCNTGSKNK